MRIKMMTINGQLEHSQASAEVGEPTLITTDDKFLGTTASSNQSESSPNSSATHYTVFGEPTCCSYCLASWRVWLRQLIMLIYIILFIAVSVVLLLGIQTYNINQFTSANFLAGIAMAFTVPMSLWGISQHLINYTKPSLQKYIIRILWMVPIYSILSFCGLHFTDKNVILDAIKDCYEAFVVYSFTCYLVRYLQQQSSLDFTVKRATHVFPFCCMSGWKSHDSIVNCTIGVLQYTLVKPIITVVTVITSILDVYKEGQWNFSYAWLYSMVFNNASQVWALYCLVLFYRTFKEELKDSRPVAKFLCIKLVIFATWWQSLAISIVVQLFELRDIKWIAEKSSSDVEVSHAIQDFAVCFEMFAAAIAHHYAFTHQEFKDATQKRVNFVTAVKNMFDIRDVGSDVINHGYIVRQKVKDRIRGNMRTRLDNEISDNSPPDSHNALTDRVRSDVTHDRFVDCRNREGGGIDNPNQDTSILFDIVAYQDDPASGSFNPDNSAQSNHECNRDSSFNQERAVESSGNSVEHKSRTESSLSVDPKVSNSVYTAQSSPVINKIESDHVQFSVGAKGDQTVQEASGRQINYDV